MPPKHNLHTHTHTHIHIHNDTGKRLFVFTLLLFCLPIDLKITTTATTSRTALSNAKNIALYPIQHLQHPPAYPLPPLAHTHTYIPLCCVCVCLPTCVAHCAHCLHISHKTVHCAYLNFTARCGFSSKRFHLPTYCAALHHAHPTKRPTSSSAPSSPHSSPPRHVRTQLVNNLRAALIEFNCTRRWGMRILIALTQVSCSSWGNLM